jgi:hypothetical protein
MLSIRAVQLDIPDAAARAFRDADGLIHLVAAHYDDRQLIGPRFDALTHPCEQIFRSRADPDPAAYADRSWLTAFFTKDGRTVHSLVHHEYQGDTHPSPLCPSRQYPPCWENSVLTTVSTDGGNHFATPIIPRDVMAVPPFRYIGETARKPVGYFQPSNIVDRDGLHYVLIKAEDFAGQHRGNCLGDRQQGLPFPPSQVSLSGIWSRACYASAISYCNLSGVLLQNHPLCMH